MTTSAAQRLSADPIGVGRQALARGAWQQAYAAFMAANAREESPEALEGIANASFWLNSAESVFSCLERAYQLYRERGDSPAAARVAVLLAECHCDLRGEQAIASGWLQRARRLLEGLQPGPEHGFLALVSGHFALFSDRDPAEARRLATESAEIGRSLGVFDLEVVGLALEGLALVSEGAVEAGMRRLDEATAAAMAGEIGDFRYLWNTCCYLISGCERVRDYDRAAQWCDKATEACERWGLRPLFAACRTHYASILIWRGAWREAEIELEDAARELQRSWSNNVAAAVSRLGELRRRQGRWEEAASLFARVEHHPIALLGRAALALDEGDAETARDLVDRYLRRIPRQDRTERSSGLELAVRLHLARGERVEAEQALAELREIAETTATDPLRAAAAFAEGLVRRAAGASDEARRAFEDAVDFFDRSGAPFDAALARIELSRTLAAQGRAPVAARAAGAALVALQRLGATREADRARELLRQAEGGAGGGTSHPAGRPSLTRRQREVLQLIAQGLSDREIATRLFLSEHTVHRHVANILLKLGLSSRAAAVATATRQGLL